MKTSVKLLTVLQPKNTNVDEDMPKRKIMLFVDGENLVFRYQSLLNKGNQPLSSVVHIPDVLVWSHITRITVDYDVVRATYYTYAVGDEEYIADIRDRIKSQKYQTHYSTTLPKNLTPQVFKKAKQNAKAKGVDIQLTVDVLTNVFNNTIDAIYLLSGDGDYAPMVREVLRCGKQVYISAFSDGINKELIHLADDFSYLDEYYFQKPK